MTIVVDSSALIALAACDGLPLLAGLFDTVRAPESVRAEVVVEGRPWSSGLTSFLRGRVVDQPLTDYVISAGGLGRGELEAMALYKRLDADFLLVDDQRARRVARLNGIRVAICARFIHSVFSGGGGMPLVTRRCQQGSKAECVNLARFRAPQPSGGAG